jgi:MinD-like ATPase involved in chromosome partitioning or flagellar assembly
VNNGPYAIRVSSQKGGVGKTTIAVNLATALSLLNYKVLLVDADHTNPSIGFHLGFDQVNKGFMDVIGKKSSAKSVIITHAPTGLHVLPGRIGATTKVPTPRAMQDIIFALKKENYDFIVFDTAPGFFPEPASYMKSYNEAIIITTPEMSSCTSAIRLAHKYDKVGIKHSLIVNRIKNRGYEVSLREIEESYNGVMTGTLPDDDIVPLSISERIPAYLINQNNKFSRQVAKAVSRYGAKVGINYTTNIGGGGSFIDRLLAMLGLGRRNRISQSLKESV